MGTQFETNTGLPYWQRNDLNWDVQFAAAMQQIGAFDVIGQLALRPTNIPAAATALLPSNDLKFNVSAGTFLNSQGVAVTYPGSVNNSAPASQTTFIWLDDSGTLHQGTAYPAATWICELGTITTNTTVITAITPGRIVFASSGVNRNTLYLPLAAADATAVVTVHTGNTHGVQLGSAGTDLLGFYGATPIVQPANTVELVALLSNLGLRASGGNPALNLGTGALTCGAANLNGLVTIGDGDNIAVGTTTGTQIATSASQKLGFYGTAPVAQPANTTDLLAALISLGLRASGGNPPLNLGTGTLTCGAANLNGLVTLGDGDNLAVGTTTGTKIGTATTQKLALWGATPIVQPSGASQAALGSLATVNLTDSTGGTAGTTISDVGATFSQTTLDNNFASLVAQINHAVTDFAAVKMLVNAIQAALVAAGIIKGSA